MSGNKVVCDISVKPKIVNADGTSYFGISEGQTVPCTAQDLTQATTDAASVAALQPMLTAKTALPNCCAQIQALWQFALTGDNTQVKTIDAQIKSYNTQYPSDIVEIGM